MMHISELKIIIDKTPVPLKRRALVKGKILYIFAHNGHEFGLTFKRMTSTPEWRSEGAVLKPVYGDPVNEFTEPKVQRHRGGEAQSTADIIQQQMTQMRQRSGSK